MKEKHLVYWTIFWIVAGVAVSWYFNDPHNFERFGALISGTSAVFVVAQVILETHLEHQKSVAEGSEHLALARVSVSSFVARQLVERVSGRIKSMNLAELHKQRMRFVKTVAGAAFVGETIHGFGDWIYEYGSLAVLNLSKIPCCIDAGTILLSSAGTQ